MSARRFRHKHIFQRSRREPGLQMAAPTLKPGKLARRHRSLATMVLAISCMCFGPDWPFLKNMAVKGDGVPDMFDELRQMLPVRYRKPKTMRSAAKLNG